MSMVRGAQLRSGLRTEMFNEKYAGLECDRSTSSRGLGPAGGVHKWLDDYQVLQ
jgi:hypothetical protein